MEALHEIHDVEKIDSHRFKIFFSSEDNPAKIIVQASVANHWALTELTPVRKTLEQIFVEIISNDSATDDSTATENSNGDQAA